MSEKNYESRYDKDRGRILVKMTLLSDTIFGNGMSVPGEEDISVLADGHGFPYYKGSTFKGVFREETERLLKWEDRFDEKTIRILFGEGKPGADSYEDERRRLVFSDFMMSEHVREVICEEAGDDSDKILECLTNIRAFTRVSEDGTAEKGSLRFARCINQGLVFYSTITCFAGDKELILEVLPFVKWIGTLRNRGFGNVRIEAIEDQITEKKGGE